AERTERLAEAIQTCGVLAVVTGSGMLDLFESIGAVTLDGGGTLNPSTYELLAGIHEVPAEEVVVLPNSPNVVMAAERAAELAERTVHVVASRSMQAGLAAAVALEPGRGAGENAAARPSGSSTSSWSRGASRERRWRPCSASSAARRSCSR